jgi:hypothetical protein
LKEIVMHAVRWISKNAILRVVTFAVILLSAASVWASDPWADYVVEFNQTIGQHVGDEALSDSTAALGAPNYRGEYDSQTYAILSLGQGGHIVLGFDQPVIDDRLNPEGYDFIVFGNAMWHGGTFGYKWIEPAYIEIAQDVDGNKMYDSQIDGPFYLLLPPYKRPAELAPTQVTEFDTDPYNFFGDTGNTVTPLAGYADITPSLRLGDIDADNVVEVPNMDTAAFYTVPDRHADPDDTTTWAIDPGSGGGDAFDIKWAVEVDRYEDTTAFIAEGVWGSSSDQYYSPIVGTPIPKLDQYGQPVGANIDRFTFIRIVDAVPNDFQELWGDIDSEIDAVADVAPVDFALQITSNLDHSVTLSWDTVAAARHYDIYYSDQPGSTLTLCAENLDTATLTWIDTGDTSRPHPSSAPSRSYTISARRD